MSNKIYNASIIGLGRIGFTLGFDKKRESPASHAFALKQNPRIKIVSGCDIDSKKLDTFKKFCPTAQTFSSAKEMFKTLKERLDIIVVAVQESAHLQTALEVINYRPRLMILEKPVALNCSDAKKIARASKKYNVPILVNHERRFALDYNLARDYIVKIGDVQSIDARLFSGLRVYSPLDELTGSYSLLHDGTHLVDIVLFFLEKISTTKTNSISAKNVTLKNPTITGLYFDKKNKSIVRNFSAHYTTKFCPSVTISISGRSRFFGFELDICGTEGRVKIGNGFLELYTRNESKLYSGFFSLEKDRAIAIPKKTFYFSNMIQNAVDFLDSKCALCSTLETGIKTLTVLEEIKNKLKSFIIDK